MHITVVVIISLLGLLLLIITYFIPLLISYTTKAIHIILITIQCTVFGVLVHRLQVIDVHEVV